MPVLDQTTSNSYTGNGVTTVFAYTFKLLDEADVLVEVDGVAKTLTTHYTVSGVGNSGGGNITFLSAPANATEVVIQRDMAYLRETDYQDNGDLLAATLDEDIDRVVMQVQQVRDVGVRSIKIPSGETTDQTIPASASARANKAVIFDASGNVTVSTDDYEDQAASAAASAATATTQAGLAATARVAAETAETNAETAETNAEASAVAAAASAAGVLGQFAASSGSSLIGHIASGAGATLTTVQAKLRESVSVKDFGAVGDGATNDSAAINAAIVAVNAAGGGVVNLDALNYAVATPIYMLSDVTLRGKGSGSTTITQIGTAASWDAIAVSSGIITTLTAAEYNDIHVIGLKLQGLYSTPIPDGAATYAVDGISIANAWNSSIEDCLVEDTSTAISFYGTVTGVVHYNNFISGCTVRDIQSWDAAGNSGTPRGILMNTPSSTVEDCIADSAYTGFYVSTDYGNYVNCRASRWTDDGFYVNANYCTFTNCYAIGNTTRAGASGSGFAVNPSTGHTFTGCVALRCPNSGMRFRHAAADAPYLNRVIGCWFSDCGYGFLDDMTDADPYPDAMAYGNVFIGNIADNNQNNGFIFIHQQSGVIQGNEAVDNNQVGVTVNTRGGIGLAEYCIDNVVQGNICRDTQGVPTQSFGLYSYPASVTGASIENTGNRFDHKSVTGTDVFFPTTQEGTSAATVLSGTRVITGSVTFEKKFEAAPTVVLTVQTATVLADAERPVTVGAYSITTTGFSYVIDTYINVAANRAITVGWTAVNL